MAENKDAGAGDGTKALTSDDVTRLVTETVTAALKPLGDTIARLQESVTSTSETVVKLAAQQDTASKAAAEAKDAPPSDAKALTLDDVSKLLDERDAKRAATQEQTAARDAFITSEKSGLAKLPRVYQQQLGGDPKNWDAEARSIVGAWESDFKGSGGKVADVGGASGAPQPPPGGGGFLQMPAGVPGSPGTAPASAAKPAGAAA